MRQAAEIPKVSDRHVFLRKEPCVASHDKFLPGTDQLKRIRLLRLEPRIIHHESDFTNSNSP